MPAFSKYPNESERQFKMRMSGSGVEGDINRLQQRNKKLFDAAKPMREGMKKGKGIKSYASGAINFARNLLKTRRIKRK